MKGLQVTKKVRTYEKVRKMYEATKKVRSYEKGPKLRKKYEKAIKRLLNSYERPWLLSYLGYEISYERPWSRSYQVTRYNTSYEKGTKLRKGMKRLRRGCEISYGRPWLRSYQVTITTFCTTTQKKARGKIGHAQNILPIVAASGHFRSKDPHLDGYCATYGCACV